MRGFLAYYELSRQYMPTEHKPGNMILMYNSQGSKLQPTKQGTKWKKKIQIKYREARSKGYIIHRSHDQQTHLGRWFSLRGGRKRAAQPPEYSLKSLQNREKRGKDNICRVNPVTYIKT